MLQPVWERREDIDPSSFHLPIYAGLTTAGLIVMQLVLMWRVVSSRGASEVLIGTGGVDSLEQRIRVHGNFVENTPVFLIGLALAEIVAGSSYWILGFAVLFVAGRLGHAIGFSMNPGVSPGRLVGTLMSMISMLATAGYLAYVVIERI
ncbi:MAG: putative membrane protein YecN with MAPEG domain [Candidatus Azotimanducaceae bacterium]